MDQETRVREIDECKFDEIAGQDAAYIVVVKSSNEQELVVRKGTEVRNDIVSDELALETAAARSATYRVRCRNGKRYCCCDNDCVRCGNC